MYNSSIRRKKAGHDKNKKTYRKRCEYKGGKKKNSGGGWLDFLSSSAGENSLKKLKEGCPYVGTFDGVKFHVCEKYVPETFIEEKSSGKGWMGVKIYALKDKYKQTDEELKTMAAAAKQEGAENENPPAEEQTQTPEPASGEQPQPPAETESAEIPVSQPPQPPQPPATESALQAPLPPLEAPPNHGGKRTGRKNRKSLKKNK
jgi:hypothetical protein